MIFKIKQLIPERFKGPILAQLSPDNAPDLDLWRDRKKVIIMLAGFYQNLGDMALTYAQKLFIERTLPDYEVLLFPSTDTYKRMKALKRVVGPEDIITTIGGGNMDDIYPSLENARRYITRSFPNHPIISFPQTMSFTDSASGRRALRRSVRTYTSHPRLSIFAREQSSFEIMKSEFSGITVASCPDIVLSLEPASYVGQRSGVMLSIRDDKEVYLSSEHKAAILEISKTKTDDVLIRDTVDVSLEDCQSGTFENTLEEFWAIVASRRLVVTDRLHAMIFCVITRTPVVVLPNSNHKIKGTYEAWLQNCSSVRFLEDFDPDSFSQAFDELWDLPSEEISSPDFSSSFEVLRRSLLTAAGKVG